MSVFVICGATATGKSELALELAEEIKAEIINADSMQLYRGMDIGTAKVPLNQRRGISHHGLDLLEVNEDSTVAWYQSFAREKISEIGNRGAHVLIVGGTGLYIKAILDDLNFPDTDPEIRGALTAEAEKLGIDVLFQRLEKLDPAAALAIDRANVRRVIRALEVIEITGKPFTANLPRGDSSRYPNAKQFGLSMDREKLSSRIDDRVELMWEEGLVKEVEQLLIAGITEGRTAQRALGYSQVIAYLDGRMSQSEAKEDTKRATRQYARRQETWFSRDGRIQWISPNQNRLEIVRAAFES